jgi:hypothetical protein
MEDENFRISTSKEAGVTDNSDAYRSWWRGSGGMPPPGPPCDCMVPEPEPEPEPERAGGGVLGGYKTLASLRPAEPF